MPQTNMYQPFLNNNAGTKLDKTHLTITSPWNDDTIAIKLPDDEIKQKEFATLIEHTILPPYFSAIIHQDRNAIEFIHGLEDPKNEIKNRNFDFIFRDVKYNCYYNHMSDQLINLVKFADFVKPPSFTNHRNLGDIRLFLDYQEKHKINEDKMPITLSFWVCPLPEDECTFIEFAKHLNFYMHYYDRKTPKISIHENLPKKKT